MRIFLLLVFSLAAACSPAPEVSGTRQDVARLQSYLTGQFESVDPATGAMIKIIIEPVPAETPTPQDGPWMLFSMLPNPKMGWMQAFYRLTQNESGQTVIESWRIWKDTVYAPKAGRFKIEDFAHYDMSSAVYTAGCDVVLTVREDGRYEGAHRPKGGCKNTRGGASYVWAEKWFEPDGFMFLENAYDDAGTIVWGPGNTGYVFNRVSG